MKGPHPHDADILAYLRRKAANARRLAESSAAAPETQERATVMRQTFEVLADDIAAGLHHDAAAVEAALANAGD